MWDFRNRRRRLYCTLRSQSRLHHHPGGAHRRARVRGYQILRGAELEAPQPPRTSSAVLRHREGV